MIKPGDIDWNKMRRMANVQAVKDLDSFLDELPLHAGYNALIAAGIAWLLAGTSVFFTATEIDKVSALRAELTKISALKPPVPILKYDPVPEDALKGIEKKITDTYKGVSFVGSGSKLTLSASDTDYFPQFLAALNTLQNGGRNWRVNITSMCVGSECTSSKLAADLTVEMARVVEAPSEDMMTEGSE